ncbi:MAG: beta-N-acetylhexosaminidase [Actinomycetota bacterium]|nr:beta-N-acetylhexosaminidase [Actinomycetota bacterium]
MRPRRRASAPRRSFLPVFFSLAVLASAVLIPVTIARTQDGDDPDPEPAVRTPSGSPVATRSGAGPSPSATSDCVEQTLERLSLRAKAGQLMVVGVPLSDLGSGVSLVRDHHVGGVFLAGRSKAPLATIAADVARLQKTAGAQDGLGLQVAVDQEGGQVQSLQGPGFTDIPTALAQGGWTGGKLTATTRTWAAELASAGITWNLAPVGDTVAASDKSNNPPIGRFDREYGESPQIVAERVGLVVGALQERRVMATVKHFPGLGRVSANTDTSTGAVDARMTMDDPALLPFRRAIEAGTSAVMISSAKYPQLDDDSIAAFSRVIVTDLLRTRLGFTGLVVSDDLGAADAVSVVSLEQRATLFVAAGGDAVLTVRPQDAGPMIEALVSRAKGSQEFSDRIHESARRILRAKARSGLLTCR